MRTTAGQFRFAQQLLSPNSISNDFLLSLARRHWMRYSILRKLLMLWYYGDRKTGEKVGLYETTAFAAKDQRSLIFVLRRPSRQAPLPWAYPNGLGNLPLTGASRDALLPFYRFTCKANFFFCSFVENEIGLHYSSNSNLRRKSASLYSSY